MVARVLQQIECDVCGNEGTRYTLSFPDGIKVLDRCAQHDQKIQELRAEEGDFTTTTVNQGNVKRGGIVLTDVSEIERKRQPEP